MASSGAKGKGGNKGKPPKFSTKPALTPSGAYFSHERTLQPVTRDDQGRARGVSGHLIIPLKAKYLR